MDQKDEITNDFTILCTPEPTASSTAQRKHKNHHLDLQLNAFQRPLKFSISPEKNTDESLGILSLNSVDISTALDANERQSNINSYVQKQRMLAQNTLDRSVNKVALPLKYLTPHSVTNKSEFNPLSNLESTIEEADLLSNTNNSNQFLFNPNDISTPRSSEYFNTTSNKSNAQKLADLAHAIGNADVFVSLEEICQKLNNEMAGLCITNQNLQDSCNSFIPSELAADKLKADELSWRQKHDMPMQTGESFQTINESVPNIDKYSIGEFFIKKSDDIKNLMLAPSPEKKNLQVPLIDSSIDSTESEENDIPVRDDNSLSISTIEKVLSNMNTCDTPNKVIDYLYQQKLIKNSEIQQYPELPNKKSSLNKENFDPQVNSVCESSSDESLKSNTVSSFKLNKTGQEIVKTASNLVDRSVHSIRSSSSLSNFPDGKLPIESNRIELLWGCVKLGKSVNQEFVLRNKSQFRIKLQASVSGSSFKLLKDRSESELLTTLKLILHPMEARTIVVTFCPTSIGACVEKIHFTPIDKSIEQTKKQLLMLFGYGGHASIDIVNVAKDAAGKCWLSFNNIDNKNVMSENLVFYNSGVLPGFASIIIEPKGLYSFTNITAQPSNFVLNPQEKQNVLISYIPSKNDYKHLQTIASTSILEIACVKIITGAEVTRGRIRRLCRKAEEKKLSVDKLHKKLCIKFTREIMPPDLIRFKETIVSMNELCLHCSLKEIIITLEQDPERTLIGSVDETTMFETLCFNNSDMTVMESILHKPNDNLIQIVPSTIILTPPSKMDDIFLLSYGNYSEVEFNIVITPENGLIVTPKKGVILPGKTVVLNVSGQGINLKRNKNFEIKIFVENDMVEVNVTVVFIK